MPLMLDLLTLMRFATSSLNATSLLKLVILLKIYVMIVEETEEKLREDREDIAI
jgi:hypothetical protein